MRNVISLINSLEGLFWANNKDEGLTEIILFTKDLIIITYWLRNLPKYQKYGFAFAPKKNEI